MAEINVTAIPVMDSDTVIGYTLECTQCGPLPPITGDEIDATKAATAHLATHGITIGPR